MAVPWRYSLKGNKILIMFNSKLIYYNICDISMNNMHTFVY